MTLDLKGNAAQASWTLGDCSSNQVYDDYTQYTEQCCLLPGEYTLRCKGADVSGFQGGYVEIQGNKYCEGYSWADYYQEHQVTIRGIYTLEI